MMSLILLLLLIALEMDVLRSPMLFPSFHHATNIAKIFVHNREHIMFYVVNQAPLYQSQYSSQAAKVVPCWLGSFEILTSTGTFGCSSFRFFFYWYPIIKKRAVCSTLSSYITLRDDSLRENHSFAALSVISTQ